MALYNSAINEKGCVKTGVFHAVKEMIKIIVIDGQGGKIGSMIIERLKGFALQCEIYAVGTNSIATSTMLKAGADYGATGENSVMVCCRSAGVCDVVTGPVGIAIADSLLGEVTPHIAYAVGGCLAHKVLIPLDRCNNFIVGVQSLSISELVGLAVNRILEVVGYDFSQ